MEKLVCVGRWLHLIETRTNTSMKALDRQRCSAFGLLLDWTKPHDSHNLDGAKFRTGHLAMDAVQSFYSSRKIARKHLQFFTWKRFNQKIMSTKFRICNLAHFTLICVVQCTAFYDRWRVRQQVISDVLSFILTDFNFLTMHGFHLRLKSNNTKWSLILKSSDNI